MKTLLTIEYEEPNHTNHILNSKREVLRFCLRKLMPKLQAALKFEQIIAKFPYFSLVQRYKQHFFFRGKSSISSMRRLCKRNGDYL